MACMISKIGRNCNGEVFRKLWKRGLTLNTEFSEQRCRVYAFELTCVIRHGFWLLGPKPFNAQVCKRSAAQRQHQYWARGRCRRRACHSMPCSSVDLAVGTLAPIIRESQSDGVAHARRSPARSSSTGAGLLTAGNLHICTFVRQETFRPAQPGTMPSDAHKFKCVDPD